MSYPLKISAFVLFVSLVSCNETAHENYRSDIAALMNADSNASALSEKRNMSYSMQANMDDSCVLLRAGHFPLKGIEAKKYLQSDNGGNTVISWKAGYAFVAASGELGYTYGIFTMKQKSNDSIMLQGSYITIWKRQKDGRWKMLLDTGTEGLPKDTTNKI